eukprot:982814-Pelagomonas_calceolata.AAC.4
MPLVLSCSLSPPCSSLSLPARSSGPQPALRSPQQAHTRSPAKQQPFTHRQLCRSITPPRSMAGTHVLRGACRRPTKATDEELGSTFRGCTMGTPPYSSRDTGAAEQVDVSSEQNK